MQKKIASLRERVGQNAVVQQGDEPHENPSKLIQEAFSVLKELESLVFRINRANLNNALPDGRSLTPAIAHRDTVVAQHSLLQNAIAHIKAGRDVRRQRIHQPSRANRDPKSGVSAAS